MTSVPVPHWQVVLRTIVFSSALLGAAAACGQVHYIVPSNLQGYVLPSGCPANASPADTTQLNACLAQIEFDTTESMGDEQRLMVVGTGAGSGLPCAGNPGQNCRYGPLAKIEPVKGAELYSDSALSEGRIIARMYLRAGETESYPKLGLVPGDTTYWWVATSPDTSVFVHRDSTNADLSATRKGLMRNMHPRGTFQQAFASWVWDETDEKSNGACGSSCCKPQ